MPVQFYEADRKIRKTLYDTDAMVIAGKLVTRLQDARGKEVVNKVNRAQIRRIFDEVKRLERVLDTSGKWDDILPLIKMVKSKTAYAIARAKDREKFSGQNYEALNQFVRECVDQVNEPRDFKVFSTLFEAVYGFYYELSGSDR